MHGDHMIHIEFLHVPKSKCADRIKIHWVKPLPDDSMDYQPNHQYIVIRIMMNVLNLLKMIIKQNVVQYDHLMPAYDVIKI